MEWLNAEFKKRSDELSTYLSPLFKRLNAPGKKFAIFAHYRSGSTLLTDLLNSHPEIYCEREIFLPFIQSRPSIVMFPFLYLKNRHKKAETMVYGCILRLDQLSRILRYNIRTDPEKFMSDLQADEWQIIYLERRNVLRSAVSNIIAITRKQWHIYPQNSPSDSKIHIDCNQLVKFMSWNEQILAEEKKVLEDLPHMTIIYEDDLLREKNHQQTLDRIFAYLGLSSVPVKTRLTRVSSDQLSEFIQNYEEVASVISKTKYASFLAAH